MAANELFNGMARPIIILDGGLGTMLENTCQIQIADTPLWSAEALVKETETIVAAHMSFLRAGARVIETATYQCAPATFERAGHGRHAAKELMHKAVRLARQARYNFNGEREADGGGPPVRICLSLGPFGATLSPTQEFRCFYPPPYGPRGFFEDSCNLNFFDDEENESLAIQALADFHFERLSLFAQDREIWSCIDMIAFETMGLAREAVAVRRAMGRFLEWHRDMGEKIWWISFIFPDGVCPQMLDSSGTRLTTSDLVRAALYPSPSGLLPVGDGRLPVPSGIGINCTSLECMPRIVGEMEIACKAIGDQRPLLALYPNGGDIYDEALRTWRPSDESTREAWSTGLVALANRVLDSPDVNWAGVIVGGCCRCDGDQIHRLASTLR